ncbi:hypothetical protein V7S43_010109 [Phytophthora oleae]|uniref:SBP-type domain-containing protein n=1 Tax=Phytophthora oleae TaxID=2107226 RepID=A0ABD3FEW4_9STRA
MTEAALAELECGPTVSLMTQRRASEPPAQPPPEPGDAVNSSNSSVSVSQTKQRSQSSGSAANSESVSGGSNAKPVARGTAKAGSTSAIHENHPEDLCRYPNKRCYNKRAVKNNGELHKFCDSHRDSANRYQRKLEQRLKKKRIQSRIRALQAQQAQAQAQAQAQMASHGHAPFADSALMGTPNAMMVSPFPGMEVYGGAAPFAVSRAITQVGSTMVPQVPFPGHSAVVVPAAIGNTQTGAWMQGEGDYEPFEHPVQLQSEDLDCLDLLFEE